MKSFSCHRQPAPGEAQNRSELIRRPENHQQNEEHRQICTATRVTVRIVSTCRRSREVLPSSRSSSYQKNSDEQNPKNNDRPINIR